MEDGDDSKLLFSNLLQNKEIKAFVMRRQGSWRRVVTLSAATGVACQSIISELSFFDCKMSDHSAEALLSKSLSDKVRRECFRN